MASRALPLGVVVAGLLALCTNGPVLAQPVISQIYGGGGNMGTIYTHDFIELFNPTNVPISLAGWSIQYASATGTGDFGFNAAQLTPLSGVIQPGQYFLIRGAEGTGGITALPAADITDPTPINLSATGGKVALVNSTSRSGATAGCTRARPRNWR